jgi:hypothetical protein
MAIAVMLALTSPIAARAQSKSELDEIRKEIQDLKDSYESRIRELEKRLKDAEDAAAAAKGSAAQAEAAAQAARTQAEAPRQSSPSAFNPAISLILNGTYGNFTQDPKQYAITGFQPPGATSPGTPGFSLGESELFVTANVDHLFMGAMNVALEPDNTVSVEEAYFQTLALGHGFTLKGGRFFSAIGYQNSIHAHAWDFVDTSLVQRAFLGDNYGDDGVQLNWVAPLPVFVEVGAELGAGRTLVGNFTDGELASNDRNKNGAGAGAAYFHVGDDVGVSNSYRAGAWYLQTSTGGNSFPLADLDTTSGVPNTFTNARIRLYGADFVWKWAPDGNYQYKNFKFVAEWMRIRRDGDLTFDTTGAATTGPFNQWQSGWYVQGAYQFHPYWRVGLRYDQLNTGSLDAGINAANIVPVDYIPRRYSAMLDWNPSEFSRIRLQYNQDLSQQNVTDHQLFLQYIYSLGTHGAHKF